MDWSLGLPSARSHLCGDELGVSWQTLMNGRNKSGVLVDNVIDCPGRNWDGSARGSVNAFGV